jgi:hypothetical protein
VIPVDQFFKVLMNTQGVTEHRILVEKQDVLLLYEEPRVGFLDGEEPKEGSLGDEEHQG